MLDNIILDQDLKSFIEASFFSEEMLPNYPFKIKSWRGILLQNEDLFEQEGFIKLCKACNAVSKDKAAYLCLTTFNNCPPTIAVHQWREPLDWLSFTSTTNQAWGLAMSGHYWLGESLQWGAIYTDDDIAIFGGSEEFMDIFEELHGGRDHIFARFKTDIEGRSDPKVRDFLFKLSQNIFIRIK
jgi:hypothetical protein